MPLTSDVGSIIRRIYAQLSSRTAEVAKEKEGLCLLGIYQEVLTEELKDNPRIIVKRNPRHSQACPDDTRLPLGRRHVPVPADAVAASLAMVGFPITQQQCDRTTDEFPENGSSML